MAQVVAVTPDELGRRRTAVEHASADIYSRGYWSCGCPACNHHRELTIQILTKGACRWCGKPLNTRKGALYCRTTCRVMAFQARQRAKKKRHFMPLFETKTVRIEQARSS